MISRRRHGRKHKSTPIKPAAAETTLPPAAPAAKPADRATHDIRCRPGEPPAVIGVEDRVQVKQFRDVDGDLVPVLTHYFENQPAESVPAGPEKPIIEEVAQIDQTHKDDHAFIRDGDIWIIRFGRESGRFPVAGNKGLKHYADLLSRPYRSLSGLELQGTLDDATEQGFQEANDDESSKRARDLAYRIDKARRNSDEATVEHLQLELYQLAEHLRSTGGLYDRQRRLGLAAPQIKAFDAVRRNIARVKNKLAACMPELATHVGKCIHSDCPWFRYVPGYDPLHPNPDWKF
jgi:hypothetical protein